MKNTFVVCHWSNHWVGFCIPHLKMVPAQPNTWACAWKLSIDLSSLPKGWLRFHAGLEGCCSSHNYSQMVFPPVRMDSNICVLPLLVKYNHHSSFPEVLNSVFCNVKKKLITWLDHWGGDPGWVGGWLGGIHWYVGLELEWVDPDPCLL